MDRKSFLRVEVKSADKGEVAAVFSTFNVRDSDGDVTLPGAFEDGAPVVISDFNHTSWGDKRPVGEGKIRTTKSEAVMDGRFFMDVPDARAAFIVVKGLADAGLGEWSYGFDTLEAENGTFDGEDVQFLKRLNVFEVSPVLRGAGVNTRTLAVKALTEGGFDTKDAIRIVERTVIVSEYKAAIRPHETRVTTKTWEEKRVTTDLPDDASIPDLRSIFAWCDPHGDPEAKSSYRFPHHEGPDGEANLQACQAHIIALNGLTLTSSKADIPDEDRRGVYNHLAGHLQDGGREPLPLRAKGDTQPLTFQEEVFAVAAANLNIANRSSEVMALRAAKNKSLASSSVEALEWLFDSQRTVRAVLDSPQDDAAREYVRFVQSLQFDQESTYELPRVEGEGRGAVG